MAQWVKWVLPGLRASKDLLVSLVRWGPKEQLVLQGLLVLRVLEDHREVKMDCRDQLDHLVPLDLL